MLCHRDGAHEVHSVHLPARLGWGRVQKAVGGLGERGGGDWGGMWRGGDR